MKIKYLKKSSHHIKEFIFQQNVTFPHDWVYFIIKRMGNLHMFAM